MKTLTLASSTLLLTAATATAQWAQITPTASPAARGQHGMAYDPVADNVVIFGGDTFSGPFGSTTDETWGYDGTTWTQLASGGAAAKGIDMVYDVNAGVFFTYGSLNLTPFGGSSVDRTWEYNPVANTWTERFPVTTPGGLGLYAMCYDVVRGRTVLYGGTPSNGGAIFPDSDKTWEWDGTNWTDVTTTGNPPPLQRPAMCYHAGAGTTVLFGGIDTFSGGTDTTWLYDGATSTWTAAGVTGTKPSSRRGPSMAYDSSRAICVMTGGQDNTTNQDLDETWEFDLANLTWTQVTSSYTDARIDSAMAFVPSRRQTVMFGGISFQTFSAFDDTWEYGAKSMTFGTGCAGSNGTPALDASDAPRFGQNYTLNATNLNSTVNIALFALSVMPIAPVALDGIGMTGCTGYAAPELLSSVTGAAGAASLTIAMPTSTSFIGVTLDSQALSLDPNINPLWLAASNGHQGVLGF